MNIKFELIQIEDTLNVTIRGNEYVVQRSGKGIPCLLICLGTPSFRTLSKQFTENFSVFQRILTGLQMHPASTQMI